MYTSDHFPRKQGKIRLGHIGLVKCDGQGYSQRKLNEM